MSERATSKRKPRKREPKVPPMPVTVLWFTKLIAEKIAEKEREAIK